MFVSETQRQIVTDNHRIKLINGCAGSRKTDTLVKLGVFHMEHYGHNLMYLTLVSSITHELTMRLGAALGIEIPRVGISNHYLAEYKGCQVTIANFDAFVHRQLEHMGDLQDDLRTRGDCHDWKTRELQSRTGDGRHTELIMKNGARADFVLVDEFQDMDPIKARILTDVLRHNSSLHGVAVGDFMQSIFSRAVCEDLSQGHPMNVWRTRLQPQVYYIDTCYRCPAGHIEFVNRLLGQRYEEYDVPRMQSDSTDIRTRPVLFTHDALTKNHGAFAASAQVCAAVRVLFEHDSTLRPTDVAVLMKRSNDNHFFEQLKIALDGCFQSLGHPPGCVVHFETRGDGYHQSIDWRRAEGKAALLSIHGDKGKGHRVVFFMGLSHRSIPSENNLFKPAELVDVSLVNVALTRSTDHLFIGFSADSPSRYLVSHAAILEDIAYTSWPHQAVVKANDDGDNHTEDDVTRNRPPELYRMSIEALNSAWEPLASDLTFDTLHKPAFDRILRSEPMRCPAKSMLRIRDDIAKELLSSFEMLLCPSPSTSPSAEVYDAGETDEDTAGPLVDCSAPPVQFGQRVKLTACLGTRGHTTAALMGVLGELLVYRHLQLQHADVFLSMLFSPFSRGRGGVVYTDDARILNLVCDAGLNQLVRDPLLWLRTLKTTIASFSASFALHPELRDFFSRLLPQNSSSAPDASRFRPVFVLSSVFDSVAFRSQLRIFLGPRPSVEVPSRVFWNVALCFNEMFDSLRRPCVLLQFNRFHEDLSVLHANVAAFCTLSLSDRASRLRHQVAHRMVVCEQDPEVLRGFGFVDHVDLDADRFQRGYCYGIVGRSDILDTGPSGGVDGDGDIFEIKTSGRIDTCVSREWIAQALFYCCITPSGSSVGQPAPMRTSVESQDTTVSVSGLLPLRAHARRFHVVNLLAGSLATYTVSQRFRPERLIRHVLNTYGFDASMIERLLSPSPSPSPSPSTSTNTSLSLSPSHTAASKSLHA
jgi:hypothetical protein